MRTVRVWAPCPLVTKGPLSNLAPANQGVVIAAPLGKLYPVVQFTAIRSAAAELQPRGDPPLVLIDKVAAMAGDERTELVDHLNRSRDLLTIMRDTMHRQTIIDLITFLESKLTEMDGRSGAPASTGISVAGP
jgi:hypothetical protein